MNQCEQCKIEFEPKPSTTGRFCSRACWYAAPGKREIPDRDCVVCGKSFAPGSRSQKACSLVCRGLSIRSKKRNQACAKCGGPLPYNCHVRVRFCSHSCAASGRVGSPLPVGTRRSTGESGYVRIKTEHGWQLEHRWVMEQTLGRYLERHERVHHRNGDRSDNRPENLELWKVKTSDRKDPPGVRASDYHCPGCRCAG